MRNPGDRVPDFMSAAVLAGRSGVARSTLDRWHREGVFIASARTEGGRRLYTKADARRLERFVAMRGRRK